MAITPGADGTAGSQTTNASNSISISWTQDVVPGQAVIAWILAGSNASTAPGGYTRTLTVGGQSMVSLGFQQKNGGGSPGVWIEFFGLLDNTLSGTQTVSASVSRASTTFYFLQGNSRAWSGVESFGSTATNYTPSTGNAMSVVCSSAAGRLLVGGFLSNQTSAITNFNQTSRSSGSADVSTNSADTSWVVGDAPGAGSVTFSANRGSGSYWAGAVVELLAAPTTNSFLPFFADRAPAPLDPANELVDDFDGPAGSMPNPALWTYDLGDGGGTGWGNNELQNYTKDSANVYLDGSGHLVIKAIKSGGNWTSAKVKTLGKFHMGYGTMSARIKMPAGQGTWPAFWTQGANYPTVDWPRCGEIDIVEYVNLTADPDGFYWNNALHGPMTANPNNDYSSNVSSSQSIAWDPTADFHVYAMTRAANSISIAIDGTTVHTYTPASLPAGGVWVFNDNPHYAMLNLAIGGDWPGDPAPGLTQVTMLIDWFEWEPVI